MNKNVQNLWDEEGGALRAARAAEALAPPPTKVECFVCHAEFVPRSGSSQLPGPLCETCRREAATAEEEPQVVAVRRPQLIRASAAPRTPRGGSYRRMECFICHTPFWGDPAVSRLPGPMCRGCLEEAALCA